MIYRIFKLHSRTNCYVIQSNDVEVKGNWQAAALKWASLHAPTAADDLDLLVARFGGTRIHELRRVVLKRQIPVLPPPPGWKVVPAHELYDDELID